MKEKIDRQLVSQSTSIPLMNIKERYHSKKAVTFDTQDRLDDKIDMLTADSSGQQPE